MTDHTTLRALSLDCKERGIDFDDVSPNQGSTSCDKLVRHYIAAASPDAVLAPLDENKRLRGLLREWFDTFSYEDRTGLYRRTEEILE